MQNKLEKKTGIQNIYDYLFELLFIRGKKKEMHTDRFTDRFGYQHEIIQTGPDRQTDAKKKTDQKYIHTC